MGSDEQDKLNWIELIAHAKRLGELDSSHDQIITLIREDLILRMEDFERRFLDFEKRLDVIEKKLAATETRQTPP